MKKKKSFSFLIELLYKREFFQLFSVLCHYELIPFGFRQFVKLNS